MSVLRHVTCVALLHQCVGCMFTRDRPRCAACTPTSQARPQSARSRSLTAAGYGESTTQSASVW
eukprot:69106-Alexandrium_andersonii.AAC.1